jgi:predicted RNase H-like HicB family nuclease
MRLFRKIWIREANLMKVYDYTAVVWKETAGYVSKCPELGVASCGDSFEEAVSNLREAVDLYLENAMELDLFDEIKESLTAKEKFTAYLEATLP